MFTLDLPPHVDEARARLLLAIGLFQEEDVPVGKAAEIAGLTYRAFVDALVERGIAPYPADEDAATIEAEMQTVRALIRERQARST
jgi:predicted HTH domain antitoxin